ISLESCSEEEEPTPDNNSNALTVDLNESAFTALQNDGGWVLHPNQDYLLVNVSGSIKAFSSRCTHQGCTRNWTFSTNATCGCHGSVFDVNGDVVTGPAQSSLTSVRVTREGGTLTIG
ncbi:MAG: Rieske (2Fe-2S) protein, partial [Bacteroidota bacterium]